MFRTSGADESGTILIGGVTYREVPDGMAQWVATLHRADLQAGQPICIPALLGQVWVCTVPIWWVPPGGSEPALLPQVALLGPSTAAFQLMAERRGSLLGCGLWPLGWSALVRRHAADHADRALDAAAIWPKICASLVATIADAEEGDAAWAALETFAADLAGQAQPSPDHDRIAVIDAWLASGGDADDLCRRLGRCPRQVARITGRTHGGPPRLIAAKWRTLQAAAKLGLASPEGAWWSDRYADQSHFIREFRRFIGQTPKGFTARPDDVPQRVVADPWHTESTHPLALFRP